MPPSTTVVVIESVKEEGDTECGLAGELALRRIRGGDARTRQGRCEQHKQHELRKTGGRLVDLSQLAAKRLGGRPHQEDHRQRSSSEAEYPEGFLNPVVVGRCCRDQQ